MDPDTRSSYQSNRERRLITRKEDAKHVLKELWNFNPDKTFHKMFSGEPEKGA